ncbi:hypothetical protein RDI58_007814 [Solanum bulbocastanum]|uniref:Uncharacterized protein n=1 Tax=Solanum bulbocastanum TaxID=147425 RepID=A0AAN8U1D7_SOLBU
MYNIIETFTTISFCGEGGIASLLLVPVAALEKLLRVGLGYLEKAMLKYRFIYMLQKLIYIGRKWARPQMAILSQDTASEPFSSIDAKSSGDICCIVANVEVSRNHIRYFR